MQFYSPEVVMLVLAQQTVRAQLAEDRAEVLQEKLDQAMDENVVLKEQLETAKEADGHVAE